MPWCDNPLLLKVKEYMEIQSRHLYQVVRWSLFEEVALELWMIGKTQASEEGGQGQFQERE